MQSNATPQSCALKITVMMDRVRMTLQIEMCGIHCGKQRRGWVGDEQQRQLQRTSKTNEWAHKNLAQSNAREKDLHLVCSRAWVKHQEEVRIVGQIRCSSMACMRLQDLSSVEGRDRHIYTEGQRPVEGLAMTQPLTHCKMSADISGAHPSNDHSSLCIFLSNLRESRLNLWIHSY